MTLRLHPHPTDPKLWSSYVDILDQTIKAGDHVAYASISGKSPQLVIAQVVRINRVDSKGEPITSGYGNRAEPACTLRIQPLIDARGFHRGGQKWNRALNQYEQVDKPREVTIQIPNNVIKISWSPTETGE